MVSKILKLPCLTGFKLPPSCYCWNDRNLITCLKLGVYIAFESYILIINIDIDKTPELAVALAYPFFQARILPFYVIYQLFYVFATGRNIKELIDDIERQ